MAYSKDFRQKIVETYMNGEGTIRGIAERFKMRSAAATTVDGLYDAFCEGYLAVTAENAQGWFRGCGYCA